MKQENKNFDKVLSIFMYGGFLFLVIFVGYNWFYGEEMITTIDCKDGTFEEYEERDRINLSEVCGGKFDTKSKAFEYNIEGINAYVR